MRVTAENRSCGEGLEPGSEQQSDLITQDYLKHSSLPTKMEGDNGALMAKQVPIGWLEQTKDPRGPSLNLEKLAEGMFGGQKVMLLELNQSSQREEVVGPDKGGVQTVIKGS
jgi:hypothetical protein